MLVIDYLYTNDTLLLLNHHNHHLKGGADRGPLSRELQAGRHHSHAGPGAATGGWVAAAECNGQGGYCARRGAHQGLRGGDLLHHVQQDQGGQVLHTGE